MRTVAFASGFVLASATWEDYKNRYGRVFNGDDEEAHQRTYETNMAVIVQQNAANDGLTFAENQFTDMTQEQFQVAAGLGYRPSEKKWGVLPHLGVHTHNGEKLADSVDWTTQGAVTAVKDQGGCGSCWAFSTTGGMEGAWQIGAGELQSMSEQQLVDCSTENAGCDGGDMGLAFEFAGTVNVATEASYPYKGVDGTCQTSHATAVPQGGISGYKSVGQNIDDFKSAISTGPVSIAIQANQFAFQAYSTGTLESGSGFFKNCGTNLDHGVLAVGYTDSYIKVKNSWGASWGMSGYIQLSTNGNTCGMFSDATYPVVNTAAVELAAEESTCSNRGHCGIAYQSCCLGYQADGFPCGCSLADGGSGEQGANCGVCGAAYTLCCAAYKAKGFACTCDVAEAMGVAV